MIYVKENKAAELLGLDLNKNGDIVLIKKNSKKNISKDQVIVQGRPRF
jgi:sugar diacid utilization regulator